MTTWKESRGGLGAGDAEFPSGGFRVDLIGFRWHFGWDMGGSHRGTGAQRKWIEIADVQSRLNVCLGQHCAFVPLCVIRLVGGAAGFLRGLPLWPGVRIAGRARGKSSPRSRGSG